MNLPHSANTTRKNLVSSPSGIGEVRGVERPHLTGVPCWIGPGSGRLTISVGREQVIASHKMLTGGHEDIVEGDKVVDQDGRQYEVILAQHMNSLTGYHHSEFTMTSRSAGVVL